MELAARYGEKLPDEPDSGALNEFLQRRKAQDPVHYADISLAVVKLIVPPATVIWRMAPETAAPEAAVAVVLMDLPPRRLATYFLAVTPLDGAEIPQC